MSSKPDSITRNPLRTRRLSVSCYLHPADPATGICASCLRERLHGLDSPEASFTSTTGNVGGGSGARPGICAAAAAAAGSPELRRCRSVYTAKCEASASFHEPRRKSCDVGSRNGKSLAHLFDADDSNGSDNGVRSKVESKNILKSPAFELRAASKVDNGGGEIRDFDDDEDLEDCNVEEGDFKTMKEYIDLELQSKGQKTKLGGNLWEAASVFSKKLQKWRHKDKKKLRNEEGTDDVNGEIKGREEKKFGETQSEAADFVKGRRSCDIDPRFSMDAGRISFDEPRASWDGYLIARTIPRLAPMLSVVENAILNSGSGFDKHRISVDGGQMHSIMEDLSSSGSGGSAQSQSNSDSSSSQRRSSFDRSSSVRSFGKKFVGLEGDEMKYGLNASSSPKKLVITERELKDWHLRSMKDDHHQKQIKSPFVKNAAEGDHGGHQGSKKQVKWRKMWSVFGFKQKSVDNKSVADSLEFSPAPACEKKQEKGVGETIDGHGWKLMRSSSVVGARRSVEVIRSSTNLLSTPDKSECVNKSREDFVLGRKQIQNSFVGPRRSVEVIRTSSGLMNTADKSGCVNKKSKEDFVLGRKQIQSSIVGPRRSVEGIRSSTGLMSSAEKSECINKRSKEDFVLEINQSSKHASSNLEDDVLPFYLTPLRTSRSRRSGRNKLQNSHIIDGHILSLT
ncbi:OLC1v1006159C1 [Oldenlandia corymbosa var. corymbosa]|uniref:OLC1v1006159C1 n=1 Tax=Oldenlandia corymbosa var. corymbosa TaxID=529605 RepID=A0AAV1DGA0_OLDCO|nr:OLC1v1006159C1 [Oldenlandia corymbosa var. corymbosa]